MYSSIQKYECKISNQEQVLEKGDCRRFSSGGADTFGGADTSVADAIKIELSVKDPNSVQCGIWQLQDDQPLKPCRLTTRWQC